MDIQTLTLFFMWCTMINVGILIFGSLFLLLAPDFVYRTQSKWFAVSREQFNLVMYSLLGLFKTLFIVFCVVPWLALVIIG